MLLYGLLCAAISFIITVLLGKFLIPVFRSVKIGQKILDVGPRWHKAKEGTPTMGGVFFAAGSIVAMLVTLLVLSHDGNYSVNWPMFWAVLFLGVGNGVIGVIDDHAKLYKKQNKGLSASQKLILQFVVGIIFLVVLRLTGNISSVLVVPFAGATVDFGIFYYFLALLGIVFVVNGANLNDGVDGLHSSVTFVIMMFFACVSALLAQQGGAPFVVAISVAAGCLGFLVYNFYPAKVFMGDTGSLFLGGMAIGMAFWFKMPLILVFVGIIYIIQALSVIIQVVSFKLTGKRVFKMSPIHHHFELSGWHEIKIVGVFSLVTAAACVIAYLSCMGFVAKI